MTAATEVWTKPSELTDEQRALPIVAQWQYIEKQADGSFRSVNLLDGTMGMLTGPAAELQGVELNDISEVRERTSGSNDTFQIQSVVIIYKKGRFDV